MFAAFTFNQVNTVIKVIGWLIDPFAGQRIEPFIILFDPILDPFQFNMEIEGFFTWTEELGAKKELLETMLNQNAPAILYSYLRPLITLITVEADMPPLVIPLMNFKAE